MEHLVVLVAFGLAEFEAVEQCSKDFHCFRVEVQAAGAAEPGSLSVEAGYLE